MKKSMSKSEAKSTIDEFFKQDHLDKEKVRKIRRLAMKYKIRLGDYKKRFCKKCLSDLQGNIKISKTHKTITCKNCNYKNKFSIL